MVDFQIKSLFNGKDILAKIESDSGQWHSGHLIITHKRSMLSKCQMDSTDIMLLVKYTSYQLSNNSRLTRMTSLMLLIVK